MAVRSLDRRSPRKPARVFAAVIRRRLADKGDSMSTKTIVVASLLLAVAEEDCGYCGGGIKSDPVPTQTYPTPGTTDTTPPPADGATLNPYTGECELGWSRTNNSATGIASVCFDGEYGLDMIADVDVSVPCDAFGGNPAPNVYAGYENDLGNNDYMVQTSWSPWLCNVNEGFGTWWASFPPGANSVCSDYTLDGVSYVIYDNYGLLVSEPSFGGPLCEGVNQYDGYFTSLSYDRLPSGPTACTPGSAEFELGARAVLEGTPGDVSVWLTPVALEEAHFPERAWLRRIEVLDWGTATNLHVAALGDRLSFVGADVSNGSTLTPAGGDSYNLAVGAAPMSTMFGTAHLPLDDDTVLPTVQLHWSCQVDSEAPHFDPIPEKPFILALPDTMGIEHDLVLWVDLPNKLLRIAPEGRFSDAVMVRLAQIDATTHGFAGTLPSYDMAFRGKLVKQGTVLKLVGAQVALGTAEFDVADSTLTPL